MVQVNTQESGFISTDELANLLANEKDTTCILNSTVSMGSDLDVFRQHAESHIPGAKFLDLTMVRDLQSPYPHMMPSQ